MHLKLVQEMELELALHQSNANNLLTFTIACMRGFIIMMKHANL